jgi:murein tripeptide amidase MpaA
MKFLAILASLTLASALAAPKVTYDGWKVYRINTGVNRAKLKDVVGKLQLGTWKGSVDTSEVVDVMVPPTQVQKFETAAEDLDLAVMHENLGASISEESAFTTYAAALAPNLTWFQSYHPIADHFTWLRDLQAAYPANSEIFSAGKSNDGRDLLGIHIWGSGGKDSKKGVVWHGTVHAREWITNMVVEYAAYTLLSSTATDVRALRDKFDYYIIPIVNPDGFAYTQTNDRMWRKNRQTTPSASCVGRDINRNWPNQWSQRGGASTSPCAEDYKGPSAGDGTETKALAAHLNSVAAGQGVKFFMDFHSYSQLIMFPYGYTCSGTVPNSSTYASLARGAAAAVRAVYGTTFQTGPICNTIYQVSGDSVDYAYEVSKTEFSMTVELRDTGNYGFVLPANQILPSAEEMWAGLNYLLTNM